MKSIKNSVHHRCTIFRKVKKSNGNWILLPIIVMPLVVTKRVKVANGLYKKNHGQLLAAGRGYVIDMNAAAGNFPLPVPTLSDVTDILDDYAAAMINAAAVPTSENIRTRDQQRETVLETLSALGNYVEDEANNRSHPDAIAIIQSAGMRPKGFKSRRRQVWNVENGSLPGSLHLTAASVKRGTHEWAYTTTPTVEASWVMVPSIKANITISGLTRGSFVSCRHRTVTKDGTSNWEGHDPIVVL